MKPKLSRAAALASGALRYFTGEKCKNGHIAERHTVSGSCLDCLAMHRARELRIFQKARKAAAGEG